jgi:hypothetical protein
LSRASREEADKLYAEMVEADVAMFTAVSHYFAGVAQIHLTKQSDNESDGFRKVTQVFQLAIEQLAIVKDREKRMLEIAQPIEYSAYYVRRHEVASYGTEEFRHGLELMIQDLSEGFYPVKAFSILNPLLARLMANWDLNARVEGVVTRLERAESKTTKSSRGRKN